MRAVVQRVSRCQVTVGGELVGAIGAGLCVLVGVGHEDVEADARQLASKVTGLRIFGDEQGKMNLSVADVGGRVLAISQFTLHGDARKGKRPSFVRAMQPGGARGLFDEFCRLVRAEGVAVETGRFGADMDVELVNQGPVTILLDTKKAF